MKRIQYPCIEKTIHFQLKEDIAHDAAVSAVKHEVDAYKNSLIQKRIKHKICKEIPQPDGSVVMKVKTQYNSHPTGDYLD